MTIAVLAKDNADPQTGCEYGKQIGDGGFILKFADGTVTDAKWNWIDMPQSPSVLNRQRKMQEPVSNCFHACLICREETW